MIPHGNVTDEYEFLRRSVLDHVDRAIEARPDFIPSEPHWGAELERRASQPLPIRTIDLDPELDIQGHFSPTNPLTIRETIAGARENLRVGARHVFQVPDGESGFQQLLATPRSIAEEVGHLYTVTADAAANFAENTGMTPRRIAAAALVPIVIAAGLDAMAEKSSNTIEVAAGDLSEIAFYRTDNATVVEMGDISSQDISLSIERATVAGGFEIGEVKVEGESLVLPLYEDEAEQLYIDEGRALASYVAFVAPDPSPEVTTPETTVPVITEEAETQPNIDPETLNDSEYMIWLAEQVNPTVEGYNAFTVDTSREDAFKDELSGDAIEPTAFVGHWTAGTYKNGVDQFVSAIKNREGNCCSVMYFMDRNAVTYRFTDSWERTAHAYGANTFTQGVEIEADNLRGENGYTAQQMEAFVYLAYRFMDANDIAIERKNFLGHEEVDEEHGRGGKIDMPTELVDLLFPKLQSLSNELRGITVTPESSDPNERYNRAVDALLSEISKDEGSWDSINTGKASDTELGGDKYMDLLGGRMLRELTVQEVLDTQASTRLSAVGRYQIVPDTLMAAVKSTGIDRSRKFDEATQNELAVDFLIMTDRKPLAGYIKGESDDIEAALLSISQLWASFPSPDSYNDSMGRPHGTGYYDGDSAGNMASGGAERVDQIASLLNELRDAYSAKHNPTPAPPSNPPTVNRNMVMIGDSLTLGYQQGGIEAKDEGYGINITGVDAIGGRSLVHPEVSGLQGIEKMRPQIEGAEIVYLGFGTNAAEKNEEFEEGLRNSIRGITDSDTQVVVPTLFSGSRVESRNEIINRVAKEEGASVIDFSADVQISSDNLHPANYDEVAESLLEKVSGIPVKVAPVETPQEIQNETTTTTLAETTTTAPSTASTRIDEGRLRSSTWFNSRDAVRHIYSAYEDVFRGSDGLVDQAALDRWIDRNVETRERNGVIQYEVRLDNIPTAEDK